MTFGFLIDEHLPKWWRRSVLARARELEVLRIGDAAAPALRTPDPELLTWCEEHNSYLLTDNRGSMRVHLNAHLAVGRHVPGIFRVEADFNVHSLIEHRQLIVGACFPEEFRDDIKCFPLF